MSDRLQIYLNDHLGGATFGLELAKRMRDENRATAFAEPLAELALEIEEERAALDGIIERLGLDRQGWKAASGWLAEKGGRLKPNDKLASYSPLSRVLEIEMLVGGVEGKLCLWRSLRTLAEADERLDAAELEKLAARAEQQIERLRELHAEAVPEALLKSVSR